MFPKGRYDFWPAKASQRHYFISNHTSVESRAVAMPLEGMKNLTLDGQGSSFVFHGLILPISIVGGSNITLRNFSIDYATPHDLQTTVVRTADGTVDLRVAAGSKYAIEDNHVYTVGEDWKGPISASQENDAKSRGVAWNTRAYLDFAKVNARELSPGLIRISGLPVKPTLGNILILWNHLDRPYPAIWVSESKTTSVTNVDVHSAIGMGFLAQRSEDVHLEGYRVSLAEGSSRYVTTIADAAHFSGCRGKLIVENGLYENMLDDGINVHGTYLRIVKQVSPDTLLLEWPHFQTFGFTFTAPGEHLQFVRASTLLGHGEGIVKSVSRPDEKHVLVTFESSLPSHLSTEDVVDNIDWQPSVIYRHNTVRHNRSRGSIFKTTKGVEVEDNTFDHLSGPGVLLAADASKWYESIPGSNITIRHNHFIDQISTYGPAPIFIKPAVTLSDEPKAYNVRNIRIEDNTFDVFQRPLLDATSVDGLIFRNNTVRLNTDYQPIAPKDAPTYSLHHARCIDLGPNQLPWKVTEGDISKQDVELLRIDVPSHNAPIRDGTKTLWETACAASLQRQ
ncbi:MAG: right-handed parallel beta-helix repeat-containing protein [Edaphobacter sp.]